jgi:hypothetical protein
MLSTVTTPTHEKVVRIRVWSTNAEELHEVMELPMNITADRDWAFLSSINIVFFFRSLIVTYDGLNIGLVLEYLASLFIY